MSQTRSDRDEFNTIIDVDAVTDKMRMNKPLLLHLFGAFPELELQLELQLQLPWWNRDRATNSTKDGAISIC